jgi:cation diffusion facilitator family transporter
VPHRERLKKTLRVTLVGAVVNFALAGGKLVAGILGHSQALVADAVESFADLIGSVIVWRGLVVAAKPPDDDHPYGHGKAEALSAAVIATLLLFAAVGIGVQSLREVFTEHPSPKPWTLLVLLSVVAIKELLFRFALGEGHATDSTAVKTDAWHHRSDAITSLAAAVGISLALIGGPRWAAADDVAAIVAAGIIGFNGWRLLRPALEELMDTMPDNGVIEEIRAIASAVDGVDNVEKCFVRRMGWQMFVDMHVRVDPDMTVARSHVIAHAVKDAVRGRLAKVRDVLVHVEPSRRGGLAGDQM